MITVLSLIIQKPSNFKDSYSHEKNIIEKLTLALRLSASS